MVLSAATRNKRKADEGLEEAVQKSMMDDEHEDVERMQGLMDACRRFNDAKDREEQRTIRAEILELCRLIITNKYNELIREDSIERGLSETYDGHSLQLKFVFMNLIECHKFEELSADFVVWMLGKLLHSLASDVVHDHIGGCIQEHLRSLVTRLLRDDGKSALLIRIVSELDRLSRGATAIRIGLKHSDEVGRGEHTGGFGDVVIPTSKLNRSQENLTSSLLQILHYGSFDFLSLPEHEMIVLWLTLIDLSTSGTSLLLKRESLNLMQQLMIVGKGDVHLSSIFVDALLGYEEMFTGRREMATSEEWDGVKDVVAESLKTFANSLKNPKNQALADLPGKTLVKWTQRSIRIALKQLHARPYRMSLLSLLQVCCRLLSGINFREQTLSTLVPSLVKAVRTLIERSLDLFTVKEVVETLSALLVLLFNLGLSQTRDDEGSFFRNAVEVRCRKLMSDGRIKEYLDFRRIVISSLRGQSGKKDLYTALVPSPRDLYETMKMTAGMKSADRNSVLVSIVCLIGEQVSDEAESPDESEHLAFLSLPWLDVMESDVRRHQASIPRLKDMVGLARTFQDPPGANLRELTLSPLSRMHSQKEWRRVLLERALSSNEQSDVLAALENFHAFVRTVGVAAFPNLLDKLVSLVDPKYPSDSPFTSAVLTAVSRALCVFRPLAGSPSKCVVCQPGPSSSGPVESVKLPDRLITILETIFTSECIKNTEMQLRLDAAAFLSALESHIGKTAQSYPTLFRASLTFIHDVDPEVREEYSIALQKMIAEPLSEGLVESVRRSLGGGMSHVHEEMARSEFLPVIAVHSMNKELAKWAFNSLCCLVTIKPSSTHLRGGLRKLVEQLVDREFGNRDHTQRLFLRRCKDVCESVTDYLLAQVRDASKAEHHRLAESSNRENVEPIVLEDQARADCVDEFLCCFSEMFHYDDVKSWVRAACGHLVPMLLLSDPALQAEALCCLERIRSILDCDAKALVSDTFPCALAKCLVLKSRKSSLKRFVHSFCGLSMNELFLNKRYHCSLFVLQHMSQDEEFALEILGKINPSCVDGGLSVLSLLRRDCEYLGYLLSFRRALMDDEHFEEREILLRSLTCLIRRLDSAFLSETTAKFLVLLRAATAVGEASVPVWTEFCSRLGSQVLTLYLPQILIIIQPLLKLQNAGDILKAIFEHQDMQSLSVEFDRAAMVLLDDDSRKLAQYSKRCYGEQPVEMVVEGCARMLMDGCESVGRVVLQKLLSILNGRPLNDSLAGALITALLHTLRRCDEADVRDMAGTCLGLVGAFDPGRIGIGTKYSREGKLAQLRSKKAPLFVNNGVHFSAHLLERCWRVYMGVLDAGVIDLVEYSIQTLLVRQIRRYDENTLLSLLPPEWPLKNSTFKQTDNQKIEVPERPLVKAVHSFGEWLTQIFLMGVNQIRNAEHSELFKALKCIVYIKDASLNTFLLPHLIIALIFESHNDAIREYGREMKAVLEVTIDGSLQWGRLAANVVFNAIDVLQLFLSNRIYLRTKDDQAVKATLVLLNDIVSWRTEDGSLLLVEAAEKCECLVRAQRWLEEFAVEKDKAGKFIFNRRPYFALERIYSKLNDVDGVRGAFACIAGRTSPTADERILALEANGDYTDALPLYPHSEYAKELKQIKCLLRLNQPQLALNTVVAHYEEWACEEKLHTDEGKRFGPLFSDLLLEATCQLRDWPKLQKQLQTRDMHDVNRERSWGANCAILISGLRKPDLDSVGRVLNATRTNLVNRLTALTMENSENYGQAYKYITRLHILEEIEEASHSLAKTKDERKRTVSKMLEKWQARCDVAMQSTSVVEPMLRVRRELIRVVMNDSDDEVCRLLLHSCRLARQAGHVQIAWTFLVEANELNVLHQEVAMEEARFEFQKGNQSQAIGILNKLLADRMSEMHDHFNKVSSAESQSDMEPLLRFSKEERTALAEVELLRAEYMQKAGAGAAAELYKVYRALRSLRVDSEDLHYRVAVFFDSMLSASTIEDGRIKIGNIAKVIECYTRVLQFGKNHLLHAMPRMLYIWLDIGQKRAEHECKLKKEMQELYRKAGVQCPTNLRDQPRMERGERLSKQQEETLNLTKKPRLALIDIYQDVRAMNDAVLASFRVVHHTAFYTCFAQLISRIVHPSPAVFDVLKTILSDLLAEFPHQCLWQSIAVYRSVSNTGIETPRQSKCRNVYDLAKKKNTDLIDLIDQYDYVAGLLIGVAEMKMDVGPKDDFHVHFKHLYDFFADRVLDQTFLSELLITCIEWLSAFSKERELRGIVRKVQPRVMVPLTEMLEHSLGVHQRVHTASQFVMAEEVQTPLDSLQEEVFIERVDKNYIVLKSLMRPKCLGFECGNGVKYRMMAKPKDELRKDARFMDVNRMMNYLMKQNGESRMRQLNIRTFSVIPLQDNGGLLEWVPNLDSFRNVVAKLVGQRVGRMISDSEWTNIMKGATTSEQKLKVLIEELYVKYPLVMDEWFRRRFVNASEWSEARANFARSTAVMSFVGFVMGLGDRHGENLLIDQRSGQLVHVDYNLIFNHGESLPVPEVVPFRLTRNMVCGLGVTGVEGHFRRAVEVTAQVMRDNEDTLLTTISSFVHDPLVEWTNKPTAQQAKTMSEWGGGLVEAVEQVTLIRDRLRGMIVSPKHKVYSVSSTKSEQETMRPMSVEGQVQRLIEIATDDHLLACMYMGWAPHL